MNILLKKSTSSLEASSLLKDEEHFASSVHCAYYSCIQLMRHILFNCYNIDETIFDSSANTNSTGSHMYLMNELTKLIHGKNFEIREFKSNFRNIKYYRKKADYQQIVIFQKDSNNAYSIALNINRTLKKIHKL